jgi:hypothetical protein
MAVIRIERPFGTITTPRPFVSVRDAVFAAFEPRYLPGRICWTVFLSFIAFEIALAGRLWVQLSRGSADEGFLGRLYTWSTPLVAPFQRYDDVVPVRQTGIFEFSTIAAMEAYLVIALAVMVTLLVVPRVLTFVITLVRGDFKLGEKHPRIVFAMDAVKVLESGGPGAVRPISHGNKPDRHGAAVHLRTRPTRGRRARRTDGDLTGRFIRNVKKLTDSVN